MNYTLCRIVVGELASLSKFSRRPSICHSSTLDSAASFLRLCGQVFVL
jgi:hypothetical protein